MKLSLTALSGLAFLASAQPHNHFHRHLAERASPVEKDEGSTPVHVETAIVTVYVLDGKKISSQEVDTCLKESRCAIVGDKLETISSTAPVIVQTPSPSPSEVTQKASPPASPVPETPQSSTDLSDADQLNKNAPVMHELEDVNNKKVDQEEKDLSGLKEDAVVLAKVNKNFPSGKIDCSEFPSDYGAVAADWIGLHGWTGVQKTPGFSMSLNAAISEIETAIAGEGCVPGSFCSYACPPGYQKSQWPSAQGATGQSIGGLFCNHRGKLELSRLSKKQLCTPGVGNIRIKNSHHKNVAVCRTDYPGTESETIALNVLPGSTVKVTCPDSKEYYRASQNRPTSAQYYINPSGYGVKDACTWGSSGSNIGNWAPVNMGVGKGDSGSTYVSLFPNAPTNPDGVLDFNIDITGDVTGSCSYRSGKFYQDGVPSPTGCTVGVNGQALFDFHDLPIISNV
ncbi:hypothetical protein K3495_g6137 [Podosphaera aphanis]|nr:hypothetical protein K3495_g6137 [Podosphaera aphanis]